jgi:hypothetical protein
MTKATETIDRNIYGTEETNGLVDGHGYHKRYSNAETVYWASKGLTITRLRLLSDRGNSMWDVSYCHGLLMGKPVLVRLPFHQLPKRGLTKAIIEYGIREGVYVKGTGILEAISTLC